tara:strand:- start:461 stop:913 length:453 start_codon:yes stop_codon:yes gene_type:complete
MFKFFSFFIFYFIKNKQKFFKMNEKLTNAYYYFSFFNKIIKTDTNKLKAFFSNSDFKEENNRVFFCFEEDVIYDNYSVHKNSFFLQLYIEEFDIFYKNFYIINVRNISLNINDHFFVEKNYLYYFTKHFFSEYFFTVDKRREILNKINSF